MPQARVRRRLWRAKWKLARYQTEDTRPRACPGSSRERLGTPVARNQIAAVASAVASVEAPVSGAAVVWDSVSVLEWV